MKKKALLGITVIFFVVLVIGATYAYFQSDTSDSKSTDVKITTNTSDTLSFSVGSSLQFSADQFTFTERGKNASDTTTAIAILTANNKTNSATEHYYIYLNIEFNNFEYCKDNTKPELLLTITSPDGESVTIVDGLEYKTVSNGAGDSISGFDVTTKNGLVTLVNNKEISTTSRKSEEWKFEITFVNYDFIQVNNEGKSFVGKIIIQKKELVHLASQVCSSGDALSSCIMTLGNQVDSGITRLYHHDANLENGANDNSYRYSGATEVVDNYVCFGSNESPCPYDNLYRIIGVIDGKVKLIKADYANSNLLGTNGDYHDSVVPNKSFYKGKLTSINTYYWNYKNDTTLGHSSNDWSTSLLNKTNLNTNYISNIGSTWANKIDVTIWKIGGNSWGGLVGTFPNVTYQKEISTPANDTTYDSKIGLMYISDYLFGANPNTWVLKDSYVKDVNGSESHDFKHHNTTNWIYLGGYEWTITHDTKDDTQAFFVYGGDFGVVLEGTFRGLSLKIPEIIENDLGAMYIRPVFNLTSSVTYVSGSGQLNNPIRLN